MKKVALAIAVLIVAVFATYSVLHAQASTVLSLAVDFNGEVTSARDLVDPEGKIKYDQNETKKIIGDGRLGSLGTECCWRKSKRGWECVPYSTVADTATGAAALSLSVDANGKVVSAMDLGEPDGKIIYKPGETRKIESDGKLITPPTCCWHKLSNGSWVCGPCP
jgi:hypothetical protein